MMYTGGTMAQKKMTIRIDETLHSRVKAKAALEGVTVSDVIRLYLERYVADLPYQPRLMEPGDAKKK
jgi:DNA-damage-inducible protein J